MKEYTPNILFRSLHYELLNRASLAVMDVADSAGRIVTSLTKPRKGRLKEPYSTYWGLIIIVYCMISQ